MSSWCMFLDPHLTTYHWNIGVKIMAMLELGTSTLCEIQEDILKENFIGDV